MPLLPQGVVSPSKQLNRRNWHSAVAAAIIAMFLAQGLFFVLTNSQTFDEAIGLGAGYSYLATGDYRLNREHPPLQKIFCALPVYLWYQLPFEPTHANWHASAQWIIGLDFLYDSPVDADAILCLARIPNLLLGVLIIYTIGLWSYQLWGQPASLFSMALAAFDPNLIAHSSLATNDMGVASFSCLTLYCFWRYSQHPSWKMAIAVGLFLGCALATKFSGIALLGFLVLAAGGLLVSGNGLLLPSWSGQQMAQTRHRFWHTLLLGGIAGVVGTLTVWATYSFGDVTMWWHGLQDVLSHQNDGHPAYFLGQYSQTGWPHFFIVAFLIKTPISSLIAIAVAISVYWKGKAWSTEAFVTTLLPICLIFAVSTQAQINIGLRYILVVYPLLFVAAGRLATFPSKTTRPVSIACVVIALVTATSTLCTAPHYLAYFNEFVGGPRNGHYYLSDSNIDWGQDLKQLARYVERENASPIYLSYFGNAPPEYYGIEYQPFTASGPLATPSLGNVPTKEKPHLLAISLYNLRGVGQGSASQFGWLLSREPIARIGYSIYVFDISGEADVHVQLAPTYRKAGGKKRGTAEMEKVISNSPPISPQ